MTADVIKLNIPHHRKEILSEENVLPDFFFECLEAFKEQGYEILFIEPSNQNTKHPQ